MNQEKCCEKNCPDYNGMAILHSDSCDCPCHTSPKEEVCKDCGYLIVLGTCKCMNLDKSCPNPHYLDDKCICSRPSSPKEEKQDWNKVLNGMSKSISKEEIINDLEKEIEEQFIEILDYGNDLTSEDVWTDVEKIQWLRKSMKSLISSTEKRVAKLCCKDCQNKIQSIYGKK